ncbi:MAG: PorT family protein [Bacteroidales bacterium]|jgi:hypothetical protein|nr:PorT family protein [Bacteroidales bacterium]
MKLVKTTLIAILLLGFIFKSEAQWNFGVPNKMKYDNQIFHFGFLIGYNLFDFTIKSKADLREYDSLMIVNTSPRSGFNLGIVTNLRMGKYFDLRFIPGLAFGDRVVDYQIRYPSGEVIPTSKNIESVYLELPLLVKFKSSRMHNTRVFVIAGAQYSLDLISAAKKKETNPRVAYLKLYPHDALITAGAGLDFYCTYFKLTTEFKMSFGMVNLLKPEDNMFSSSVTSLKSRQIQISVIFE